MSNLSIDKEQEFADLILSIDTDNLKGWDKKFVEGLIERYESGEGPLIFMTYRMWEQLRRIAGVN